MTRRAFVGSCVAASVLIFFVQLLFDNSVAADDATALARIRPAMQQIVDQGEIAGAVTVVGRKNAILSVEAVGQMDIERHAPMTKDAIFHLASMTRPVVAIAIMQLQEEGKLNVDDPVAGFRPGNGFGLGWELGAQPQGMTALFSPGGYGHLGAFGTQGWIDPKLDVTVLTDVKL